MPRVLAFLVVAVTAAGAAAFASAAQSPGQLRSSILAAARTEHSVHWAGVEAEGGVLVSTGADVTRTAGTQHVTFQAGKKKAHIRIIVTGPFAYVEGDATGLGLNLGLTNAQATRYAGQWISIPKGDKLYVPTAQADTLGSLIQVITPHGRLSSVSAKLHGVRVTGVRGVAGTGKKKRVQVLVTHASGKPLPLEEDEVAPGQNYVGRTTLSKWNEPVHVTAPASSVPIATVRAS